MAAETHQAPASVTVTVTLALDPAGVFAGLALGAGRQVLGFVSDGEDSRPYRGWLELLAVLESQLPPGEPPRAVLGLGA